MFGLSFGELLIICVVALLVLGPQGLPTLARTLGKLVRQFRVATADLRSTMEEEFYRMDEPPRVPPRPGPEGAIARAELPPAAPPAEGAGPAEAEGAAAPPEGADGGPRTSKARVAVSPEALAAALAAARAQHAPAPAPAASGPAPAAVAPAGPGNPAAPAASPAPVAVVPAGPGKPAAPAASEPAEAPAATPGESR